MTHEASPELYLYSDLFVIVRNKCDVRVYRIINSRDVSIRENS